MLLKLYIDDRTNNLHDAARMAVCALVSRWA